MFKNHSKSLIEIHEKLVGKTRWVKSSVFTLHQWYQKKTVPAIETFLKYISIIVIERRGTTVVVLSFCGGFLAKLVELYKFVPLC